jgi:hypothetical protein
MGEVDDNNDGVIAFEEFEAAMRSILEKRSSMFNQEMASQLLQ